MQIGIFGREQDPLCEHLRAQLEARGAEARMLDLARMVDGAPLAYDGDEWLFEGEELSSFDAFVVRKVPAETALLGRPEAQGTAEQW